MNKTVKAVLLSALVFPGCGQLWLRHYRSGCALLAISLGALAVVVNYAMKQAAVLSDQILAGDIPLDPQAISAHVTTIANGGDSALVNGAEWVIVACWVIGIIDAYRIGRQHPQ